MLDLTCKSVLFRASLAALALGGGLALSANAAELTNNKPATFTKDIAPIFQEKCQDCHRKGTLRRCR